MPLRAAGSLRSSCHASPPVSAACPRPGQIDISDPHRDAQSGEPARDGGTDSARAAGDQRGAALQP